VPTLAELLEHPEHAVKLPASVVTSLLGSVEVQLARHQRLRDILLIRAAIGIGERADGSGASEDRLLDARGLANVLGVSKSWVDHNADELPSPVRVGARPRWRLADVHRWMRSRPAYGATS
jgi:predicted DNA-binding transcriptional regulator AlpA